MHAARIERIDERLAHVLLADQLGEAARDAICARVPDSSSGAFAAASAIIAHPRASEEAARASTPPAPDATATVAPFRAWRGSRLIVAEEPTRATMKRPGRAS